MKRFVLVVLSTLAVCADAVLFEDSFDDNSRDKVSWGQPIVYPTNLSPIISFAEQNQRMEFVAGIATNEPFGIWMDLLGRVSAEVDWTFTAELHNSAQVVSNNFVKLEVDVFNYNYEGYAGLSLGTTSNGLGLFKTAFEYPPVIPDPLSFPEPLEPDGVIRISYTATNQVLEIAYANGVSNDFHRLFAENTSGWPDILSGGFTVSLYGETIGAEVESGEVYFDNIFLVLGTFPTLSGALLDDGSIELSFTGDLEQTADLTEAWSPVTNSPRSPVSIPATNAYMYFRSRMQRTEW